MVLGRFGLRCLACPDLWRTSGFRAGPLSSVHRGAGDRRMSGALGFRLAPGDDGRVSALGCGERSCQPSPAEPARPPPRPTSGRLRGTIEVDESSIGVEVSVRGRLPTTRATAIIAVERRPPGSGVTDTAGAGTWMSSRCTAARDTAARDRRHTTAALHQVAAPRSGRKTRPAVSDQGRRRDGERSRLSAAPRRRLHRAGRAFGGARRSSVATPHPILQRPACW